MDHLGILAKTFRCLQKSDDHRTNIFTSYTRPEAVIVAFPTVPCYITLHLGYNHTKKTAPASDALE